MDDARANATVLHSVPADGLFAIDSIALGPAGIYFGSGGSILRLPLDGGTEEVVVADHSGFGLHVTGTHVYWLTLASGNVMAADLWRAPLGTLPATAEQIALVGSQTRTYGPGYLYFLNSDANTLERVSLEGGTPTVLVADVSVAAMQVHAGYVYYTDLSQDGVFRVPVDGGTAEPLTSGSTLFVQGIATDGVNVYWADDEEITLTPVGALAERTLLGYGGPGLMGNARVDELRLSGDRLFFNADNNIGWISVDGSQCDLYLTDGFPDLGGWALDDQYVYVVYDSISAAEIWRFAR